MSERPAEQARAAIAAAIPTNGSSSRASVTPFGAAQHALAALMPDSRTVGEWLDEAAVAERIVGWAADGRLEQSRPGRWHVKGYIEDVGDIIQDVHIVDPEAAALLARLGSGGGVPDGEGDA